MEPYEIELLKYIAHLRSIGNIPNKPFANEVDEVVGVYAPYIPLQFSKAVSKIDFSKVEIKNTERKI